MGDIRYTSGKIENGSFSDLTQAELHAMHEIPEDRAVAFWKPSRDGRTLLAVRPAGANAHEVTLRFDPFAWWQSVPSELRALIAEDPTRGFRRGDLAALEDVPNRPSPSVVTTGTAAEWREPYEEWTAQIDPDVAAFIDAIEGRTKV